MRRPTLRAALSARQAGTARGQPARTVLGPHHPLARVSESVESNVRQLLVVAVVLAGGVIARNELGAWAPALARSAFIVLLGLTVVAGVLQQRKRDRAIDVILEGRDRVPIAAVQRQRRRLRAVRTRRVLARTLEGMIQEPSTLPAVRPWSARALGDARVVGAVVFELRVVIELLRADAAPARGVALVERLITDGGSALYGHQVLALREELHRVGHLLQG